MVIDFIMNAGSLQAGGPTRLSAVSKAKRLSAVFDEDGRKRHQERDELQNLGADRPVARKNDQ
jgi:hypothetical protein